MTNRDFPFQINNLRSMLGLMVLKLLYYLSFFLSLSQLTSNLVDTDYFGSKLCESLSKMLYSVTLNLCFFNFERNAL